MSTDPEDRLAWLALILTPGMGPTRTLRAMSRLERPAELFSLPLTGLESLGMPAGSAQFLFEGKARAAAQKELELVCAQNAGILTHDCLDYPDRLREIFDPPPVLWYRGDASLLCRPGIAVVGTRHPSPYGAGMAQMLARELAGRGLVILSGMARGVDTEAHRGALDGRGKTVAVWGTGVDVIYPKKTNGWPSRFWRPADASSASFRWGPFPLRRTFPCGTGCSAA